MAIFFQGFMISVTYAVLSSPPAENPVSNPLKSCN